MAAGINSSPLSDLPFAQEDDIPSALHGPSGIQIVAEEAEEAPAVRNLMSGASGSLQASPPVIGSMNLDPEPKELSLSIENGGRGLKIGFKTDDQKTKHADLHKKLTASHPRASINVSRGYLMENGQIVKYLNQDIESEEGKLLFEMRQLYHEALGQRYSDMNWPVYKANDRAASNDPAPFQKRAQSDALKKMKFEADSIPKVERAKEYYANQMLQKGISDALDKQMESIDTRISLDNQSRKNQLQRVKDQFEKKLDKLIMSYHAAFPPPDLSPTPPLSRQQKIDALGTYKAQIKNYLEEQVKKNDKRLPIPLVNPSDLSESGLEQSIEETAKEMALTACLTREDYDFGCLALNTEPKKTSPEFFIMRLGAHIANGKTDLEIEDFINAQFSISFGDLSHEEDKDAIRKSLGDLARQIRGDLTDEALNKAPKVETYNQRIVQLDIVKKQRILAAEQKKLNQEIKANGPTPAILPFERVASLQERLADSLKALKTPSDEDYRTHSIARIETILKNQETVMKTLEAMPGNAQSRSFISRQKDLLNRQQAFLEFIKDKGVSHPIKRWHVAPELAPVSKGLDSNTP